MTDGERALECRYELRTDAIYDEENQIHTVYGVDAWCGSELKNSVPDVFFDRMAAEDFVHRCNKYALSLIHLMDVIEDALV